MSIINPEMDNCNLTGFETEEEMIDGLLKLLDEPTLFAQEHNTPHHNALCPSVSFPMSPNNNTQELNTQHHNASFPMSPNNNAQDLNAQYPNAQHHNTLCPNIPMPS